MAVIVDVRKRKRTRSGRSHEQTTKLSEQGSAWSDLARIGALAAYSETSCTSPYTVYLYDGIGQMVDVTDSVECDGNYVKERRTGAIVGASFDSKFIQGYSGQTIGMILNNPANQSA